MAELQMENQVGLGVDIVKIARMEHILERTPSFASRVFSPAEVAYATSKVNPAAHFATRFAAKEAVLKALGTGFEKGISPRDVEVVRQATGKPVCVLSGRAAELAAEQGILSIPISLSYTHEEAVACALAITAESAVKIEQPDPMAELSKQFKEARSLLDEIDAPERREDVDGQAEAAQDDGEAEGQAEAAQDDGEDVDGEDVDGGAAIVDEVEVTTDEVVADEVVAESVEKSQEA